MKEGHSTDSGPVGLVRSRSVEVSCPQVRVSGLVLCLLDVIPSIMGEPLVSPVLCCPGAGGREIRACC